MVLIGFTVFKEKILDGTKRQTIRKLRKYPVKEGDKLYLYWHLRQKDCEKLCETICTETLRISMSIDQGELCIIQLPNGLGNCQRLPYFQMLTLANADGFRTVEEMKDWFIKTHGNIDGETFQVIRWR
jgi:hypothetical protein